MQRIGFHELYACVTGPNAKPGSGNMASLIASFRFETDVSFLFPYINSVADRAQLHENPRLVRFRLDGIHCVVYPDRCVVTPLESREHALEFREKLVEYLNRILEDKDKITPKHKVFRNVSVIDILRLLPKTNCGECGFTSCVAFAAMLSKQKTRPDKCPNIGLPLNEAVTYPVYDSTGAVISSITLDVDSSGNAEPSKAKKTLQVLAEPEPEPDGGFETANQALPQSLTQREIEVLSMMVKGLTNRKISQTLNISPHTVKSHVVHIFNKLGVGRRAQAVAWAVRHHLE